MDYLKLLGEFDIKVMMSILLESLCVGFLWSLFLTGHLHLSALWTHGKTRGAMRLDSMLKI